MYIYENDYDFEFDWVNLLLDSQKSSDNFNNISNTCGVEKIL